MRPGRTPPSDCNVPRPSRPSRSASASAWRGRSARSRPWRRSPKSGDELNAEHQRLSHGQALLDAGRQRCSSWTKGTSAPVVAAQALDELERVLDHDPRLLPAVQAARRRPSWPMPPHASRPICIRGRARPRRPRRAGRARVRLLQLAPLPPPAGRTACLAGSVAGRAGRARRSPTRATQAQLSAARKALTPRPPPPTRPRRRSAAWRRPSRLACSSSAWPVAASEIALNPEAEPQSRGLESAEFLVAGHAGSTPRLLSGGGLRRRARARAGHIAVTTAVRRPGPKTLIFDEIASASAAPWPRPWAV